MDIRALSDGAAISVKVQPRSSRNRIVMDPSGSIKAYLNAPPVDGAANQACIALFSDLLRVPKSQINIMSGQKSRNKVIKVIGVAPETILALLEVSNDKN